MGFCVIKNWNENVLIETFRNVQNCQKLASCFWSVHFWTFYKSKQRQNLPQWKFSTVKAKCKDRKFYRFKLSHGTGILHGAATQM